MCPERNVTYVSERARAAVILPDKGPWGHPDALAVTRSSLLDRGGVED
jgi:hypothetical protein